jgi:L-serine kinase (ADP)
MTVSTLHRKIELIETDTLLHIEDYGRKKVEWLKNKITEEGFWTVPLKLDKEHHLVMDGQHRMEVAKAIGLKFVPCMLYTYDEVNVWSLRSNHKVDQHSIIKRALSGDIYPYKTAKHSFPDSGDVTCCFSLEELKGDVL